MSLCGNHEIFVGRGFSHDINTMKSMRLQPLKFRFFSCHTDSDACTTDRTGAAHFVISSWIERTLRAQCSAELALQRVHNPRPEISQLRFGESRLLALERHAYQQRIFSLEHILAAE
jgi:hypothetical protein